MFEASMKKLEENIRQKDETGAKNDIKELRTIAKNFKLAPTGGPTSG
jgi:hypothetical protein